MGPGNGGGGEVNKGTLDKFLYTPLVLHHDEKTDHNFSNKIFKLFKK